MLFIMQIICLCILVGLMVQIKWSLAQNTIGGNKFKFGSLRPKLYMEQKKTLFYRSRTMSNYLPTSVGLLNTKIIF
jgi:hypothetical protein